MRKKVFTLSVMYMTIDLFIYIYIPIRRNIQVSWLMDSFRDYESWKEIKCEFFPEFSHGIAAILD